MCFFHYGYSKLIAQLIKSNLYEVKVEMSQQCKAPEQTLRQNKPYDKSLLPLTEIRKRGRPKGSKNVPKNTGAEVPVVPAPKKRGRPLGSKNK